MAGLARKLTLLGRELTGLVVRGGKLARLTHPRGERGWVGGAGWKLAGVVGRGGKLAVGRETPVVLKTCWVAGCCHVLALMILLALPLPASLLLWWHKSTLVTGGVPILSTPWGGRIRLTGVVGLEGTVPQTLARWVAVLR